MNNEIQCIISGKIAVKYGTTIHSVSNNLGRSAATGSLVKTDKHFKIEETKKLKQIVGAQDLWVKDIKLDNYISEGAEQKVYLKDDKSVIKLNNAIYYLSWIDYFNSLLLNNYFFPDTAYNLLGFFENGNILYSVVEQLFIKATETTDLNNVQQFMQSNGFNLIQNNDYINPKLGIIIEDLHDENVLTNNGILYFIDTVFYIQ